MSFIPRGPHQAHLQSFHEVFITTSFHNTPQCLQLQMSLPAFCPSIPSTPNLIPTILFHNCPQSTTKTLFYFPYHGVPCILLEPSSLPNFSETVNCSLAIIYLTANVESICLKTS